MRVTAKGSGVPLGMSRIHPGCPDSDASVRSVAADVLLRQEPDEEDDEQDEEDEDNEEDNDNEEEEDDDEEGDDEGEDDGYSE
jgi:hypothetical protein